MLRHVVNSHFKQQASKSSSAAFTLMEVLVVVAILGFVGMASFNMSNSSIRVKHSLAQQETIIFDSIRIWQWIERDIEQLVDRQVRGALGEHEFSLIINSHDVSFSKAGWINPLEESRSELQRIQYRFDSIEGELLRTFWPVMDIDQETESITQVFSGIAGFELEALDNQEEWHNSWPVEQNFLPGEVQSTLTMPRLIRVSLTTQGLGKVSRQFLIPSYPYDNE